MGILYVTEFSGMYQVDGKAPQVVTQPPVAEHHDRPVGHHDGGVPGGDDHDPRAEE